MDKTDTPGTNRRQFIGACGSAAALACAATSALSAQSKLRAFEPSALTDVDGQALTPAKLKAGQEYIFRYPFQGTPCFLIDLGKPAQGGQQLSQSNGQNYVWHGGIGPNESIVAFSAICAHKLSHPSPVVSFIGYRSHPVGFLNRKTNEIEQRAGVIQCCSEHSIYDPAQGARVMSGPAPQPLAAVELKLLDGVITATGVYGGLQFERFFEQFGNRLMLEHRGSGYALPVGKTTQIIAGADYSKNHRKCG